MTDNFEDFIISQEVEIAEQNEKFGIISHDTGEIILPYVYDNIFHHTFDCFVLIKDNMYGIFKFYMDTADSLSAECCYDSINLTSKKFVFLVGERKAMYMDIHTGKCFHGIFIKNSGDHICIETEHLEGHLINKNTGNVISLNFSKEDADLPF